MPSFVEDVSGVDRNVPTAAAAAGNGTGPPAPIVSGNSADERGSVTFGSGTTPAAGSQITISFVRPQDPNRLPVVQITETTTALSALNPAVTSVTSTGFTIGTAGAPTGSQVNTTYGFAWALVP